MGSMGFHGESWGPRGIPRKIHMIIVGMFESPWRREFRGNPPSFRGAFRGNSTRDRGESRGFPRGKISRTFRGGNKGMAGASASGNLPLRQRRSLERLGGGGAGSPTQDFRLGAWLRQRRPVGDQRRAGRGPAHLCKGGIPIFPQRGAERCPARHMNSGGLTHWRNRAPGNFPGTVGGPAPPPRQTVTHRFLGCCRPTSRPPYHDNSELARIVTSCQPWGMHRCAPGNHARKSHHLGGAPADDPGTALGIWERCGQGGGSPPASASVASVLSVRTITDLARTGPT
eukprot:gene10374-biopygen21309